METVKRWGGVIAIGVLGLALVGYGVWEQIKPREVKVEILSGKLVGREEAEPEGEVVVDVAGAVEKPGVYKLPAGSRIGDALVAAGGLAQLADREWVAQNVNLAEKVEDGEKIYLPVITVNSSLGDTVGQSKSKVEERTSAKVNINRASVGELDSLEGIGEVRAQAIIANRPYTNTEEVVSKAKIPSSVYEKISSRLSVY